MNALRTTARHWLPTLAYMALIWTLSSIPKVAPLVVFRMQDKLAHLIEYGILGVLCCYSIARTWPEWRKPAVFVLAAFAATLWGAIDEWHQSFVPNRNADVMDALADALGATIGSAIFFGVAAARQKYSERLSKRVFKKRRPSISERDGPRCKARRRAIAALFRGGATPQIGPSRPKDDRRRFLNTL